MGMRWTPEQLEAFVTRGQAAQRAVDQVSKAPCRASDAVTHRTASLLAGDSAGMRAPYMRCGCGYRFPGDDVLGCPNCEAEHRAVSVALAFTLPLPPSVNALYGVNLATGEKFLTPAQRAFRKDVVGILALSGLAEPLAGRLELTVELYQVDRRRQDISNRIKALEDALAHAGAFHDDSQVDRLIVHRRRGDRAECLVELRELA